MDKHIKNKVVTDQISGENFKYYKFLSYEKFTDNKTGETVKFEKNARITYTLIANQFARLLQSGHFITKDNNNYIRLDTKELAKHTNITEQTIKTKIKFLTKQNLIVVKDNLVHVPFPEVHDPRSTFVDEKGNVKLTFSLVPKYLIEHSYYKEFTENSILYYSLTRERFIQSHLNNANGSKKYVDNHGNTCCYFTNEEAQSLLGISEDTLKKDRDLLYAKGLLKSNKVNKALTYQVLEPIALPLENEVIEEEKTTSTDENLANLDENLDPSFENLGLENLKVRVENFEKLGLSNTVLSNTSNNNTNTNDMYDMYVYRENSNSTNQTNQSNNQSYVFEYENYKKKQITKYLPEHLGSFLNNFEAHEIKSIKDNLFKAKKSYENDLKFMTQEGSFIQHDEQTEFTVEDLEIELASLMKRLHGKRTKDIETIKEMTDTGYIFSSIKAEFVKAYDDFYNTKDLFKNNIKWAKKLAEMKEKQCTKQTKNQYQSNKGTTDIDELNALGVY